MAMGLPQILANYDTQDEWLSAYLVEYNGKIKSGQNRDHQAENFRSDYQHWDLEFLKISHQTVDDF
jgi:hypothetical protein